MFDPHEPELDAEQLFERLGEAPVIPTDVGSRTRLEPFIEIPVALRDALLGEYHRLRAIEDAARWHHANSACAGWLQGEVLALALALDPDAPRRQFENLLESLAIDHEKTPDWLS